MATHARTLTRPGWRDLASNLTAPNLDWTTAEAGLPNDHSERHTLFRVVGSLLESISLPEFLTTALKVSDSLIPSTTTGFDVLHPVTSSPLRIAARGGNRAFVRSYELTVRTHDAVLEAAVTSRRSRQCSDLYTSAEWLGSSAYCEAFGLLHLAHVLYVPLVIGEYVIGTLNFGRPAAGGRYSEAEIVLAMELASVLARTIARELSRNTEGGTALPSRESDTLTSLLSPREHAIAQLVSRGLRDQEIADRQNLSLHTVKQYLKQIYRKTSLRSRVDLAVHMVTHDTVVHFQ